MATVADIGRGPGEAHTRGAVEQAGFTCFRRAAETPFDPVFESGVNPNATAWSKRRHLL